MADVQISTASIAASGNTVNTIFFEVGPLLKRCGI